MPDNKLKPEEESQIADIVSRIVPHAAHAFLVIDCGRLKDYRTMCIPISNRKPPDLKPKD